MSGTYPGLGGCPHCGLQVLFALHATGELVALDEGGDGPVAVRWDCTGTPRVRSAPFWLRMREGESRFRIHNDGCIALAPVVSLDARRRPAPVAGRRAGAR